MANLSPEKRPVGMHKFRCIVLFPRKLLVVGVGLALQVLVLYPHPNFVWTGLLLRPTVTLSQYLFLVGGCILK